MNEMISIVVPIYNVEKYLEKCIDSMLNQSYKNIEIILVNDGSTDSSGEICDRYADIDNRITVIHKKNGGLSDARNAALDVAKGSYVTFVDSDDYIKEDYILYLYTLLRKYKSDISVCEFDYMEESGKRINHPFADNREMIFDREMGLKKLLGQKLYTNSSSGKLFKMEHFRDIRYPYGKLYEDTLTIYKLFLKAERISFGANPLYCYIYHNQSISKSGFSSKQMECIYNTEIMIKDVLKEYPSLENACKCRLLDPCVGMLKKVSKKEHPEEYQLIIKKIYTINKVVLFSKEATLKRRVWAFLTLLGEEKFVEIMRRW